MAPSTFAGSTSMDVPQTQNTAPVLEFRCLYTHDLRRKQKRWQDGRLKFHTFNKRVMVYDERSNYIGDTHWREDTAFDEGEELELERGGIMVEVGECVGKRDQDLSELVDKRLKDREDRAAAKVASSSPSRPHPSLVRISQATPGPLQHKPLNALLTNTGHYGRAVVPNTSPFEEKQRLINGNQDGLEDGRPAKRRKPNENAPSKSGYARNLMGATLSLASSRPSSTASIRYEPVRARPATREPPTPTIDLTSDNDEDQVRGKVGVGVREERVSKERRDKVPRKTKRSPPRNGYASNLTGASLTLSRPDNLPARQSKTSVRVPVSIRPAQQERSDSSTEPEEDSFVDIESVVSKLPAVQKPSKRATSKIVEFTKRTTNPRLRSSSPTSIDDPIPVIEMSHNSNRKQRKAGKRIPINEDRSSSPTVVELPTPKPTKQKRTIQKTSPAISTAKSARIPQKLSLQNSSTTVPTPGPPASLLRIKARPPRKMMMLMSRPSSRVSGTVEPSSSSRLKSKPHHTSGLDSSGVTSSPAMLNLDAICQRQDDNIQASPNGKRVAESPEEISSSPDDSGIDHQTIDLLLSCKSLSARANSVIEQKKITRKSQEPDTNNQVNLSRSGLDKSAENGPISKSKVISEPDSVVSISHVHRQQSVEVPCPEDQYRLPEFDANSNDWRQNLVTHCPVLQNETMPIIPAVTPTVSVTVARKGEEEQMLTKVSQSSPTMSNLPEHFNSAIQAATDRFRAMIKSSAGSDIQIHSATVFLPDKLVEAERPHSVPLLEQKEETLSGEVVACPGGDIESEQSITGLGAEKVFSHSVQISAGIQKTRVINPATRGKSLQSIAANTIDSLAPVFSLMPPPPAPHRITTRPQRNLDRNVVAEERPHPAGYDGNRTIAGPWSRESYDLFGSWLPPRGLVNFAQANNG